jgi:hypothetical protein
VAVVSTIVADEPWISRCNGEVAQRRKADDNGECMELDHWASPQDSLAQRPEYPFGEPTSAQGQKQTTGRRREVVDVCFVPESGQTGRRLAKSA